jgi:hypothetical protein
MKPIGRRPLDQARARDQLGPDVWDIQFRLQERILDQCPDQHRQKPILKCSQVLSLTPAMMAAGR